MNEEALPEDWAPLEPQLEELLPEKAPEVVCDPEEAHEEPPWLKSPEPASLVPIMPLSDPLYPDCTPEEPQDPLWSSLPNDDAPCED